MSLHRSANDFFRYFINFHFLKYSLCSSVFSVVKIIEARYSLIRLLAMTSRWISLVPS